MIAPYILEPVGLLTIEEKKGNSGIAIVLQNLLFILLRPTKMLQSQVVTLMKVTLWLKDL
jgi:hypothetical protein